MPKSSIFELRTYPFPIAMKKFTISLLAVLLLSLNYCFAQSYYQDFDGNDTSKLNSIIVHIDTGRQNIWQVGAPHKHYFDSAYSRPNVIVTDTSIPYPVNNTSIFTFELPTLFVRFDMYAVQWVQKIDMDSGLDGGIVEFSMDTGKTWYNAFNANPYVYNFYGFNPANEMVLPSGDTAFSGTDSTWRDIWLCFNLSVMPPIDSLYMRYRFTSDSVNQNREGWMMDNFGAHITVAHPVKAINADAYIMVYPRLTTGIIYIKAKDKAADFKIQTAELLDESGQMVQQFDIGPGDCSINIVGMASGWYTLRVKTTAITQTYRVWLKKN